MISGLRWVLDTVSTAADAEMNDDTALREQLMDAAMRRESGELSPEEFADIEADLLARIREIKERQGGSGPLTMGAGNPIEAAPGSRFEVEATVEGDWERKGSPGPLVETPAGPARTNRTRTPQARVRQRASGGQALRTNKKR